MSYQSKIAKPGKVQAIAIMCLVDSFINLLIAIVVVISCFLIIGLCFLPIGMYAAALFGYEIVYGMRLLADSSRGVQLSKGFAIMQTIFLINPMAILTGILSLIFFDDPEVKAYFGNV